MSRFGSRRKWLQRFRVKYSIQTLRVLAKQSSIQLENLNACANFTCISGLFVSTLAARIIGSRKKSPLPYYTEQATWKHFHVMKSSIDKTSKDELEELGGACLGLDIIRHL